MMRASAWAMLLAPIVISCVERPTQLIDDPVPSLGITRVFRAPTGGRSSSLQLPAVDHQRFYLDQEGGHVVAYDRLTGAEVWRAPHPRGGLTAVVVHGDRVLFASSAAMAVDAETGAELWRVPLDEDAGLGVTAAADGVFFVAAERWLYALDVEDGTELWRKEIGAGFPFAAVVRGVTTAAGVVYVTMEEFLDLNGAAARAHLVAVEAADGDSVWRYVDDYDWGKRGARFEATVGEDVVIVADTWGHEFVGVDRAKGTLRYRIPNEDPYWAGPLEGPKIRNDTAFAGSGDGRVTAWNAATGEIFWRTEAGGTISSIVPCGKFILAQDLGSIALDRRDGTVLARPFHQDPHENGLLVTRWVEFDGTVYVGGTLELFAFRCTG